LCYTYRVKQTLLVKLAPTSDQAAALLATMEVFNVACNHLAGVAFASGSANKFKLQHAAYHETRERFGLSAQMTVRAISQVCEAFKRDRAKRPSFRPHAAMPYDERIMAWKGIDTVSLLTLSGRMLVPVRFGDYQAARLDRRRGQADLIFRDGKWFLAVTVDVPEPEPIDPEGVLGCDLGIANILTDSDGNQYSGAVVKGMRRRHRRLRARLQAKGTKSAKRLLARRRRKERRFGRHTNHVISKQVVALAKDTKRAIALEDLQGIRDRCTVRKPQRATFSAWSFGQLRAFIDYKAHLAGVPVVYIDPRNTSRTCPTCGHIDPANRRFQAVFLCTRCAASGHADHFAAVNIGRRGASSRPYADPSS
jgi:IS605 OrfB family transposase